jgi:hypothetical protein
MKRSSVSAATYRVEATAISALGLKQSRANSPSDDPAFVETTVDSPR